MNELWVALGAVVLIAMILHIVHRATRLDRLHNDVLRSRATLERLLSNRAHIALEMVGFGEFDLASALIVADAATRALDDQRHLVPDGLQTDTVPPPALAPEGTHSRAMVESELSQVLRDVLAEPETRQSDLAHRLLDTWEQVAMACQLHNQKVTLTRRLRSRPFVRLFRLAGVTPMPVAFDMDDARP